MVICCFRRRMTSRCSKTPGTIDQDDEAGNQEVLCENFSSRLAIRDIAHHAHRHSPERAPSLISKLSLDGLGTNDPNWQCNYKSVHERNGVMLCNDLMSDVLFNVGTPPHQEKLPAHKYVLATGSSVFYAMFHGALAAKKKDKQEIIDIPDVDPTAFFNMLEYLYCDDINLEQANVLSTLYAAKKYMVPYLANECVRYMERSLCAKNACVLLSQSRLFEETELLQRCWEVIDAQAEVALKSEGFTEIDFHTLRSILERETLNSKEVSIFEASVRWSEAECLRQDLEPTATNKRKMLSSALYLIRVPTMELDEFADGVAQSEILTLQETTDVFLHFTAQNKPELKFASTPRRGLLPQRCHRFQSSAYRSNQWRYRGRCDSIQFMVDRRLFMAGYGLYGSSNGASEYTVKIELKCMGTLIGQNCTRFFSDGSSKTYVVYFDYPLQVEPGKYYTASAILDGPELSYFGQEGMAESTVGNVNFQFQCSSDSTNGTGVQGGQIPELIFYS